MTILLNENYEALRPFLERLPDIFEQQGETIYDARNKIKILKSPLDGTPLCVKRYQVPRGINRFVYSLGIRKAKGLRAYLYPQRLLEKGIETPAPVAYLESRRAGLIGESYFVSLVCPYSHRMYEFGDAAEGTYEEFAAAFAAFTARLHEAGVMHLDYSPGNILWEKVGENEYHFALVDINRMHFGEVSVAEGCKNLKRLWGPKRFFCLIARHYATCRGYDADRAEAIALEARRRFWTRYQRKHEVKFTLEL